MKRRAKMVMVRLTKADAAAWRALAERDDRTLSNWVRMVCNQAARACEMRKALGGRGPRE